MNFSFQRFEKLCKYVIASIDSDSIKVSSQFCSFDIKFWCHKNYYSSKGEIKGRC